MVLVCSRESETQVVAALGRGMRCKHSPRLRKLPKASLIAVTLALLLHQLHDLGRRCDGVCLDRAPGYLARLAILPTTHHVRFGERDPFAIVDQLRWHNLVRSKGLHRSWLRCKGCRVHHVGSRRGL